MEKKNMDHLLEGGSEPAQPIVMNLQRSNDGRIVLAWISLLHCGCVNFFSCNAPSTEVEFASGQAIDCSLMTVYVLFLFDTCVQGCLELRSRKQEHCKQWNVNCQESHMSISKLQIMIVCRRQIPHTSVQLNRVKRSEVKMLKKETSFILFLTLTRWCCFFIFLVSLVVTVLSRTW